MKKLIRVAMFFYRILGFQWVVSEVESFVLRYKLRVRMVPVSYKLFVFSLGLVVGGSVMFVRYSYPLVVGENKIVVENIRIEKVQAKAPEAEKEKSIEEKIADTFPENPSIMLAIAKAESGLNPLATNKNKNGTRDTGLMQINSIHGYDDLDMMDVDKNLDAARKIYDLQGITAWAAFNNGSYKQFLR